MNYRIDLFSTMNMEKRFNFHPPFSFGRFSRGIKKQMKSL